MTGLMLHENAKQLIKRQEFEDAIEVLDIGGGGFFYCDSKLIELLVPDERIATYEHGVQTKCCNEGLSHEWSGCWECCRVSCRFEGEQSRFENALAAEAVRRNENDTQKALDDLTNPETYSAIQLNVESRRRKGLCQEADAATENLVSVLKRNAVNAHGTKDAALNHLLAAQSNPIGTSTSVSNSVNTASSLHLMPNVG